MKTITVKLVVDDDDVDIVDRQVEEFLQVVSQPVFVWHVTDATKREINYAERERNEA